MMQAELHGHASREVGGIEDYLTSTIFGHLRYLPAGIFWDGFFSRVIDPSGGKSLSDYLRDESVQASSADRLAVHFWPSHKELGTPDLCLCFTGKEMRPLIVMIEAKLDAGKSGTGENDQLLRYLRLLRRLPEMNLPVSSIELERSVRVLIFLTPHDSSAEIQETITSCKEPVLSRVLFRAQWQDIADEAFACSRVASGNRRFDVFVKIRVNRIGDVSTLFGRSNKQPMAARTSSWH